ncbi:MAG TPA: tetratricopeptide repeat protein [Anaeromyxobacteraceae bacterium]|nr:tetratricopeptide repeat protein [Anaeromyxobacteraceae bacterium]
MTRGLPLAVAVLLGAGCAGTPSSRHLERAAAAVKDGSPSAADHAAAGFHAWLEQGNPAAAADSFQAALALDPSDPWAHLGRAMLAERSLDDAAEAQALLALARGAPDHPLAPVAVRRLVEIGIASATLSTSIDEALAALLASGRLHGVAAYRARVARAALAEARGRPEDASRHRRDNGTAAAWSVAGPFGAYHAHEFDRPFAPETGPWLARWEVTGGAAVESRPIPFPDGAASLDGEPLAGDVFYLAADVRLEHGGEYLLTVGCTVSMKAFLDGVPLVERRAFAGWPPTVKVVAVELAPGTHRLLVKLTRGSVRPSFAATLARRDGAPSDAAWSAATGGGGPVRAGPTPAPLFTPRELAQTLEPEAGPGLARLVAARDRMDTDRQSAVALLEEAVQALPGAAPVHAARGDAIAGDGSQADRTAQVKAAAAWREALKIDPGDASTQLELAELALVTERLDDARQLLKAMPGPAAQSPKVLLARARLLGARHFPEASEALALEGWQHAGSCAGAAMAFEMASHRDALAREDELARALAACPSGRERMAEHHRIRGDLSGAAEAWALVVRAAPARVDARMSLARALVAAGRADAAVAELEDVAHLWPRDPRIQRRLGEVLELSGQSSRARAARERALALDGSDLALRRALALEDGTEVLASLASDGEKAVREYRASGIRPPTSAALVLDAAAVEAYPDGSYTERIHQVTQVLDTKGVERWGEVEIPGGAVVLGVRTWKAGGRVLDAEDPGGDKRTISAAGLEPGDLLEVEWMRGRPARGPAIPGWSADPFFFRGDDLPFFHSTYAVAAPPGGLEVEARNMATPPVVREAGRDVVRADAWQVEAQVPEPDAPSISEFFPMLSVGAGAGLDAAALAAADAVVDRLRPCRDVEALAATAARPGGAGKPLSGEPLVRSAYEKVMEAIEGTGSLGDQACHVVSRGRGSRTLALAAVLEALGFPARIVLVRPFPADPGPHRFPRTDLYSQAVLRVPVGNAVLWLDPSLRWAPFGAIPSTARGSEGLLLPAPGEALQVVQTPADATEDRYEVDLRIAVAAGGDAVLEGSERFTGYDAAGAKAALEELDERGRKQAVEHGLGRSFRGLSLETVSFEGERRTGEPLVIRYRARVPGFAQVAGGRLVVEAVPFASRLGSRYAQIGRRETPLLLPTSERATIRLAIVPPDGATPVPAPARTVEGPHGRYLREERVEGGALVRVDRTEIARARIPVSEYAAFARFAAEVDEAQAVPVDLGPAAR